MFKRPEERDLEWAREHLPLLTLRRDREVLRIVKEARDQVSKARVVITIAGVGGGYLLADWVQKSWLARSLSEGGEIIFLAVASGLFGMVGGIASEHLVRRRMEMIANGRPGA